MNQKIILYIATSLDGFIADSKGGVDWLPQTNDHTDSVSYKALLERITVIVMGRHSYEQILTFGKWAWPDKQTYVFTSQNLTTSRSDIKFVKGNIKFFVETIKGNSSNGDIWLLGGAEMVKSFAKEKLIDECIITVVPFSIGSGIKLELPLDEFVFVSEKSCIDNLIQRHYMRKNL